MRLQGLGSGGMWMRGSLLSRGELRAHASLDMRLFCLRYPVCMSDTQKSESDGESRSRVGVRDPQRLLCEVRVFYCVRGQLSDGMVRVTREGGAALCAAPE